MVSRWLGIAVQWLVPAYAGHTQLFWMLFKWIRNLFQNALRCKVRSSFTFYAGLYLLLIIVEHPIKLKAQGNYNRKMVCHYCSDTQQQYAHEIKEFSSFNLP